MKRRTIYIAVFLVVTGLLLLYNVILPSTVEAPVACPGIFASLNVNASGFAYQVGEPWFAHTQLVLPPGTGATITLTYTSAMNNLSAMYLQPRGVFGFEYQYLFPVGSPNALSINGTGIAISLSNASFPSIHEAVFTISVSAGASARQGTYDLFFPSTCGSGYYLVVGSSPYLLPTPDFLGPLALVVFDVLIGLFGVLVVHVVLTLYGRRKGQLSSSEEEAGHEPANDEGNSRKGNFLRAQSGHLNVRA